MSARRNMTLRRIVVLIRVITLGLALSAFLRPIETAAQQTFGDAIRIGDSAWVARRYVPAKSAYLRAVSLDSAGSTQAIFRLGILRSWDGELQEAIALFGRYVRLEPRDEEGRIALARTYAWAGETNNSVAVYDSILSRDATYRDAALGAAQALAWGGKLREALVRYDRWTEFHPRDTEASLARARALAWAGRLGDAGRAYAQIAADGDSLEGRKGSALIAAWKGDLFSSEDQWSRLAHDYPNDGRVWLGLAQVLRWSGRAQEAHDALAHSLVVAPDDADVRVEARWIRGALAPAVMPSVTMSWDSDGNRVTRSDIRAVIRPIRLVTASLGASQHQAELGALSARSLSTRLGVRWLADRHLTLNGDVGVVQTVGRGGALPVDRSRMIGSAQATVTLSPRISIGGNIGRDLFDETAVGLLSSIDVTSENLETAVDLGGRASLGIAADRARFTGGSTPNQREGLSGALRWRAKRSLMLALNGRAMRYSTNTHDGYFSPEQYRLGEVTGRYEPPRDLGWSGFLEGGAGLQSVLNNGAEARQGTRRVGVGVVHRWSPGNELAVEYGESNVAGTAATAGLRGVVYSYQAVTLRGRVKLR
ncbi:MAG: hypothetical protein ABIT38_19535 [Gemmatimonadaceae bacterium]